MSKLGLVIVLILMAGRIYAQDYFVLIEADNGQPFYVRVDSQYYSSSARGHLILSQLKDSSYTITIGFPGQLFPERQFSFSIHQNDHAFRLKNEEGKGWWLVDDKGQELASLNGSGGGTSARIPGVKKDDAFSRLMADLVRDTAVMYNTYAAEPATPTPVAATPTPAAAASVPPALSSDSQALSGTRAADTTASTAHIIHDSVTTPLYRPIHDSAAAPNTAVIASISANPTSTTPPSANPAPVRDSSALTASTKSAATPGDSAVVRSASTAPDSAAKNTVSTPLYQPIPRKDTAATAAPLVSAATTAAPATSPAPTVPPGSTAPASTPPAPDPIPAAGDLFRPVGVTKLAEHRSSKSLRQVYTDHDSNGKADTVVIIIPLDTPAQSGHPFVNPLAPRVSHPVSADSGHVAAPQGHGPNPDTPAVGTTKTPAKSTLVFVNSDCHNFATDYDVDKLRVKMLESSKDEDRILAAGKIFKTKCFSTRQIRALCEVFTTDAAKFKFLEAAYPFVSDDHFSELSTLLADPVYSGRFRAMVSHP